MSIMLPDTPWCIDTPTERGAKRTIHSVTCTGPATGKVVPLHNMKRETAESLREFVATNDYLRLCPVCLPKGILWCDFDAADTDGRVTVDSGILPPGLDLSPGDGVTAQDLMGDVCPAVVAEVDDEWIVLRLDLTRRQAVEE